jgi:hypothetical protein
MRTDSSIAIVLAAFFVASNAATTQAAEPPAFSRQISLTLVADSIWSHCELSISVDRYGQGSQKVTCDPDGLGADSDAESQLLPEEVASLREVLREADLFRGQFWGVDNRGVDAPFVTLAVHDETRAAILVCVKNESFESGPRALLLAWLLDRMQSGDQDEGPK